jgi:serine/threonine protein kinase
MLTQMFNLEERSVTGYTHMVDYWCLGVTMFKLLCGQLPFSEDQVASLVSYLRMSDQQRTREMPDLKTDYNRFLDEALMSQCLFSVETGRFISRLFDIDHTTRIGSGKKGLRDIQSHPCFRSIKWDRLERRSVLPPFIPQRRVNDDSMNGAHASFFDCLAAIRHKRWDMATPSVAHDIHFASWSFVSARALKVEVELEQQRFDDLAMKDTYGKKSTNDENDTLSYLKSFISFTHDRNSKVAPPVSPHRPKTYGSNVEMMISIERKCVTADGPGK